MEPSAGYVDVNNGRLYYETAGDGDETVVFIHGRAGDRRHWDAQFNALAADSKLVRYDVRCFGRSSLPDETFLYSDRDDLLQLLNGLGIESAHFVGWSMGCEIAVDFIVANPSRARSLVAVGPWVHGYAPTSADAFVRGFDQFAAEFERLSPDAVAKAWSKLPFWTKTVRDPRAGVEFERIASNHSWTDLKPACQQEPLIPRALDRLSEIAVPLLILTAEHDIPACLEVADLLDKTVPKSTKVVMPGTGHLMHMEHPEEFNKHLVNFLQMVH